MNLTSHTETHLPEWVIGLRPLIHAKIFEIADRGEVDLASSIDALKIYQQHCFDSSITTK